MFKNYFNTAFRNLRNNKIYGFLNIGGLAIGISCAVFIFLWAQNELTYDHQHIKRDRLFGVMENQSYDGKIYTFTATPGPLAEGMINDFPEVANTCKVSWYTMHHWLQNFAYRVDIYWWLFVVAGILALCIALITLSFQSIKAAFANPVDSLRSE